MSDYPCPEWLRCRKISDREYAAWLDGQSKSIWQRETKAKKRSCETRAELKAVLHAVAWRSTGFDPYSGIRFSVDHMREGWVDEQAHLNHNRHHRTMRRTLPSFDHVRGLGRKSYELCTRETNSAKSFMSPKQFVDLCERVARHQQDKRF